MEYRTEETFYLVAPDDYVDKYLLDKKLPRNDTTIAEAKAAWAASKNLPPDLHVFRVAYAYRPFPKAVPQERVVNIVAENDAHATAYLNSFKGYEVVAVSNLANHVFIAVPSKEIATRSTRHDAPQVVASKPFVPPQPAPQPKEFDV